MISTGLDRLLADPRPLRGRSYGLLAHAAAVAHGPRPIHLALAATEAGPPRALFSPEHGFYGVEQDMVATAGGRDPWTGAAIASLYGDAESTLRPRPSAFTGLDLLIVDLQDVGSRYYTYAATAIWAAEAALAAGCEVWVLDRPNPLGGLAVEGNLPDPGYSSFVGAFALPVRHGLTLGELMRLEASRRGWGRGLEIWVMEGWTRAMHWGETGLPWIAPSPNMPTPLTALIYPGGCLIEATELSEGRGTARPFQLAGAPGLDPLALADRLAALELPGVAFLPTYFRPQFQKHRGALCGGVEVVVTDPLPFRPYATGVHLLRACAQSGQRQFAWRAAPYEFVSDRPAIDLLTGGPACRAAVESAGTGPLDDWMAGWSSDEARFRAERRAVLLYPEPPPDREAAAPAGQREVGVGAAEPHG
jgi:uncharacterized protein YbbC (DUF1343 family)